MTGSEVSCGTCKHITFGITNPIKRPRCLQCGVSSACEASPVLALTPLLLKSLAGTERLDSEGVHSLHDGGCMRCAYDLAYEPAKRKSEEAVAQEQANRDSRLGQKTSWI